MISTGGVFFGKRVLVCDRRWSCFMCSWGGRVEYAACSSMYAAIRAVSGRASPRRKPTPSSVSRSPDEYDALDSDGSLTAFTLNSVVYLVPPAMVPSSPIKLEEIRNKNQFIGDADVFLETGRKDYRMSGPEERERAVDLYYIPDV